MSSDRKNINALWNAAETEITCCMLFPFIAGMGVGGYAIERIANVPSIVSLPAAFVAGVGLVGSFASVLALRHKLRSIAPSL